MMLKRIAFVSIAVMAMCLLPQSTFGQSGNPWTAPRIGVWKVTGRDDEGVRWQARFNITGHRRKGSNFEIRGVFRWRSNDVEDAGREYVKGTFSPATGKLSLRGYAVKSERGAIMRTTYAARVSNHGTRISKGRWYGKDVVPGIWRGQWQKSK